MKSVNAQKMDDLLADMEDLTQQRAKLNRKQDSTLEAIGDTFAQLSISEQMKYAEILRNLTVRAIKTNQ